MIEVTPAISLDESELSIEAVRSSGPGGQHVNKVATAVQLRFDVAGSPSLPDDVRERLMRLAGRRVTAEGELILEARRYRSQERNRRDAVDRLVALIVRAAEPPKARKKTKPTKASKKRRLDEKSRRSSIKKARGRVSRDDD